MKTSEFITALQEFPEDSEIYIADSDGEFKSPIFKLMHFKEWNCLGVSTVPRYVAVAHMTRNVGDKRWINPYDNFYMWDDQSNIMKWSESKYNKTRLEIAYKQSNDDYDKWYSDMIEFQEDFHTVGGLIKILRNFDKNNTINLQTGQGLMSIHSVRKESREYISGHPDALEYPVFDEIDLVAGFNTDKGMISVEDSGLTWFELRDLIEDKLLEYKEKGDMTIAEVADKLSRELTSNYRFNCRINGSIDCNGFIHMFDNGAIPFKHYIKEGESDE